MSADATTAVLIVDDDELQRELMRRVLADDYECEVAANVSEARDELAKHDYSLVLCDINMPGQSGLELARELAETRPEIAVTMVTGVDDPEIAKQALDSGALDYIVKPYRPSELRIGVANSLRRRELERAAREHLGGLEHDLEVRLVRLQAMQASLDESRELLDDARVDAIQRLSLAVEARDCVTAQHVNSMIKVVERFALVLGYDDFDAAAIGLASSMHDVGKIGIPDAILLKPGPLTAEERVNMQRHSEIGFHILAGSPNHLLQLGATIALAHHERFDGAGYPNGIGGEAIPIEARIVQIVDVYSALTSDRPYRDAMPAEVARRMISEGAGSQFDPKLVDLFLASSDAVLAKEMPPSDATHLAVNT